MTCGLDTRLQTGNICSKMNANQLITRVTNSEAKNISEENLSFVSKIESSELLLVVELILCGHDWVGSTPCIIANIVGTKPLKPTNKVLIGLNVCFNAYLRRSGKASNILYQIWP